jgi:hypothetical protein
MRAQIGADHGGGELLLLPLDIGSEPGLRCSRDEVVGFRQEALQERRGVGFVEMTWGALVAECATLFRPTICVVGRRDFAREWVGVLDFACNRNAFAATNGAAE